MDFQDQYQDGSYLETTVDWHEHDAEWKAKHIRRLIDLAGISPRTIADIGCGTGGGPRPAPEHASRRCPTDWL